MKDDVLTMITPFKFNKNDKKKHLRQTRNAMQNLGQIGPAVLP